MERLYADNKKLIRFYVIAAIIFSIMMCISCVNFADDDVSLVYGGTFGTTFEQAAEFAFGTSISPSYIMGLSSALSILKEVGVEFLPKLSFGLCDLWAVRILSFLWVALTMLTPVIGEEMEKINTKYVGPFMIFAFEFVAIMELGQGSSTVNAAGFGAAVINTNAAGGVLLAITEFFKIIFMLCAYFFVRYFNYALSALVALCTGLSATMSAAFRVIRAAFVTAFLIIAENYPGVFYVFYALLLLMSILVFRWAYRTITYFKAIYIAPVKRAIFHRNETVPLTAKRIPKKLEGSELAIPVFSLNTRVGVLVVKARSKFYLSVDDNGPYIYRSKFLRRPEAVIRLENMYIREAGIFKKGFLEISDEDRRVARLVFSREYKSRLDEILSITGYGDHRIVEQKIKEEKKLRNKQKREAFFGMFRHPEGNVEI
ncbi:hypothetical protein SAMN02910456_00418 [Ruminococcaceae bacterium YRB3002]|nr:hypothetical protein SAMN02910456_00418 [Ruminococcaceae bacterium YRB3002]